MITINLTAESGITTGQIDVFQAGKTQITGFVNVKTDGVKWYFSIDWRYGSDADFGNNKTVYFDNLLVGKDVLILNEQGQENYPTTDGGYTDYRKDIYRVCDRARQIYEEMYPNLTGQIVVSGIPV